MSDKDKELDLMLRCYQMLTPTQQAEVNRRVIERARVYRDAAIKDLFRRLFSWIRQRTAAAQLHALDDRMLKDIGLYRGDIETAVRGSGQPTERRKAA